MDRFSEKVMAEDIKAGIEKTNSYLIFSAIFLLMILIGFCVNMTPESNTSVSCTKVGGQWIPEDFKNVNGYMREIKAYCSIKK